MTEFIHENLSGSRFEDVYLTDSHFFDVDLQNARFEWVDLRGVKITGAMLANTEINGELESVVVNGVDVVPLVEAELNRRYPDRIKMKPTDPTGFREAWDILERLWVQTVKRARQLPPVKLHERVNGEWSFIQTLRHLVFATDAWVNRVLLGDPTPWDPLGLPFDGMTAEPSIPWDREARPPLDEVLALRADRMATVRKVLADLTDERLSEMTDPVLEPGYPASESYPVREVLSTILNEEWEHRLYAERDLAILEMAAL